VVGVSWYEADAYCSWLTEHLRAIGGINADEKVRLPREAEWEYAARGTTGWTWPWGNDWDPSLANTSEGGVGEPTAVGMYPGGKSPFEVFDMAGNVWEWCEDRYPPDLSNNLRGGSWSYSADFARCACRGDGAPVFGGGHFGFRCVVVPRSSPKE